MNNKVAKFADDVDKRVISVENFEGSTESK